ncbi:MAG: hypothetical protein ACJZ2B_04635 [Candidatus Neomarinimicrobiota bacterium]
MGYAFLILNNLEPITSEPLNNFFFVYVDFTISIISSSFMQSILSPRVNGISITNDVLSSGAMRWLLFFGSYILVMGLDFSGK